MKMLSRKLPFLGVLAMLCLSPLLIGRVGESSEGELEPLVSLREMRN